MNRWDYHGTRLVEDARREVLWKSLWRFCFSRLIAPEDTVLDVGCGHGCFINSVQARHKIAMDPWDGFVAHIQPGTQTAVAGLTEIDFIEDGSVDFAFLSNVAEHVTKEEFSVFLEKLKSKLSAKGTLNLIQPNYRYCSKEYFDDFTHITIYSHISLADFLSANGYEVFEVHPRFLPLTVKSRLPVWPFLIWVYLKLPVKPLGGQMFIRARRERQKGR
jgi:2-polyprenyl-3-methyl-5-hydroxy-6-metoxy-1,4-benzoquinol methylase